MAGVCGSRWRDVSSANPRFALASSSALSSCIPVIAPFTVLLKLAPSAMGGRVPGTVMDFQKVGEIVFEEFCAQSVGVELNSAGHTFPTCALASVYRRELSHRNNLRVTTPRTRHFHIL